jgi:O-antigen ligase
MRMNFPQTAYQKLLYYGRHSVTGRFFGAVGRGFDRLVAHSLFFSALGKETGYDCAEKSFFGRGLHGVWSVFSAIGVKGETLTKRSILAQYAQSVFAHWQDLPAAYLGSFCVSLSILFYTFIGLYGFLAFAFLGLFLLCVPCSLGAMLYRSKIIRLFINIEHDGVATKRGLYWVPFLFGMIASMIGVFWGFSVGAIFVAAVLGGLILLLFPQAGILSVFFAAPFMPTMVLAGLIGIIFFSYIIGQMLGAKREFHLDNAGALIAAFGLCLLFYGVTSFTSVKSTQIALLECCFILGYFLIFWLLHTRQAVRAMVFIGCLAALICGIIGLYQYLSGDVNTTWTDTELFTALQLRVYSTFENPNVYGEYLLLALPMAAVMAYIAEKPLMKLFYGGTALLLLANLALTYSRGCYLALIFVLFLVVCWGARQLLIFVPFALAAMPFVLPDSILDRFASILNFSDNSTSYRLNIWLGTLNMLEVYWFLGIGLGQEAFTMIYSRYQLNQIFAPHAHNLYLQITTEMGLGGLILFFAFLLAFFAVGYMAHRKVKGSKTSWFIITMMAAVGGFLFEGVFDNVWYNYRVFLIFFMILSLVGVVSRLVLKEGKTVFDREQGNV